MVLRPWDRPGLGAAHPAGRGLTGPAGSQAAQGVKPVVGRTLTFILNRDVATGQAIAPSCGPRRTKADFVAHVRGTIATDPEALRWHFAVDNLDIHRCEPLVRLVALSN
jgi:hypothetical protein